MFFILKILVTLLISGAAAIGAYYKAYDYIGANFNLDNFKQALSAIDVTNSQFAAAIVALGVFSIAATLTRFILGRI